MQQEQRDLASTLMAAMDSAGVEPGISAGCNLLFMAHILALSLDYDFSDLRDHAWKHRHRSSIKKSTKMAVRLDPEAVHAQYIVMHRALLPIVMEHERSGVFALLEAALCLLAGLPDTVLRSMLSAAASWAFAQRDAVQAKVRAHKQRVPSSKAR